MQGYNAIQSRLKPLKVTSVSCILCDESVEIFEKRFLVSQETDQNKGDKVSITKRSSVVQTQGLLHVVFL